VHLAALVNVGESQERPISYYITNLNGTMNVMNKVKTKNFIFASTGAAQDCISAYGVSKRAAEDVVRSYTKMAEADYTIFRFYNVIGTTVVKPTNPDGLFYNLIKAKDTGSFTIYGTDYPNTSDGTCVRDYVHVEEICHAIKMAIEKPANKTECLGHGVGYTVQEMSSIFQQVNDCDFDIIKGPRRDGDIEYYVLEDVSPYMKNLYTVEDLLRID
jgi:UDP-glucose 4-epimerase